MKANEEDMTPTEAAGYIAGVGFAVIRRYYRTFAILFAFGGLGLILTSAQLTITSTRFVARFGDGAYLGATMIALSLVLWLLFKPSRR